MPDFPAELPTLEQLRAALERQLARRRPNTTLVETVSPSTLLKMTDAFGAETQFLCRVASDSSSNGTTSEPAYAVGILCWSIPVGGRTLLESIPGGVRAKVGFGYQRTDGEFLSILASKQIADDYPIRTSTGERRTLADFIASEQRLASFSTAQACRAAGLAYYIRDAQASWTGRFGETMSLVRLADYELARPVLWNRREAMDRLFGLTTLSRRFERERAAGTADAEMIETLEKLDRFFALVRPWVLSQADERRALWTGDYLGPAATDPDSETTLLSSGVILRWVLTTASDDEIYSERTRRRVWNLALLLEKTIPSATPLSELSDRQIDALSNTLAALALYLERTGSDAGL